MKTKEFIKLLQREDPTGESYIRINGDPIWLLEGKEGYWDGPYNYLEKDKDRNMIWVESTKGSKVDVRTIDLFDFAERHKGNWEEMKKHIRFEYTYLNNDDRINQFLKDAKQECDEYNSIMESIRKRKINN